MIELKIQLRNEEFRQLHYYLRRLYNKRKNISLNRLFKIAAWKEAQLQAKKDVEEFYENNNKTQS